MKEDLLQFIWRYRYFDASGLTTTEGDSVSIIHTGVFNTNQGPDFLNARIRIGQTVWAGHVELHILSSGWQAHGHSSDPHYDNVILHVVWEDDIRTSLPFPTVVLQGRVSGLFLEKYKRMMHLPERIPCAHEIGRVRPIIFSHWKQRLVAERIESRVSLINGMNAEAGFHWEDILRRLITRNFGLLHNAEVFEKIADSIPFAVWQQLRNESSWLEAVLMGQAGLLDKDTGDTYQDRLRKEYHYLCKKYHLSRPRVQLHFFRMRPAGFPTIRLAQLAALYRGNQCMFDHFRECRSLAEARQLLNVQAGKYWSDHFQFGIPSVNGIKRTGDFMIRSLLLNAVIPVLFSYAEYYRDVQQKEFLMGWMEELPAEKNAEIRHFEELGVDNDSALDSQGLLQLYRQYCLKKRCLECAVGINVLNFGLSTAQ